MWFGPSRQQQLFCLGTEVFWLLVENDDHRGTQEQRDDAGSTSEIQKGGDGEGCLYPTKEALVKELGNCLPESLDSVLSIQAESFCLLPTVFSASSRFMHCFICQGRCGLVGIRVPDH